MYWKLTTPLFVGQLDQTAPDDYNGIKITAWSVGLSTRSLQVRFEYGVMAGDTNDWTWWSGMAPRGSATVHSVRGNDFDTLMGTVSSAVGDNAYDLLEQALYVLLSNNSIIAAGAVRADGDLL